LESVWKKIEIEMDSVNWRGDPIHLTRVPALQNTRTGRIAIDPEAVSRAELRVLADQEGIEPRDLPLFMLLCVKVGPVQQGYIHHRYRLNKMLFYQWKELEKEGLGEAFNHDNFVAKEKGPVPEHLEEDIKRLESNELVKVSLVQWGKTARQCSKTTELTEKGLAIAKRICSKVPEPFLKVSHEVKQELFPLDPLTIREKVHRDYPEYRRTYLEIDAE